MTSLGPSRESYKPSRKSRGRPRQTAGAPAPLPAVSAQRMCAALSAATCAAALLRRAVPEGGAGLVAVESPGEIPGYCDRQTATERAKPALSGACQGPKTTGKGSSSRRREGNHYEVFSAPVVTVLAATRGSCASGARRRNTSARTRAGVRWSASGSVSGTGNGYAPVERNPRAVWCPGGGNGTAS
jgi:hypothetical protein